MQALKKIFTRAPARPQTEEVESEVPILEVEETAGEEVAEAGKLEPIYVKSVDLQSLNDVQIIANELKSGNIVIIDITALMNQDPAELKRAIDQLKGICHGIGGDIGRLTESKVLVTPRFIRIQFKKAAA
jgi:SepF-like predicted cell division protein (DUF552 family)